MSRPGDYPMTLYRGDTYAWQFRLWKDVSATIPADLTGVVAKAEIREKPGGEIIATMTCTVTQPNIIDVHLPEAAWDPVTYKLGAWDLQLTYPDSSVVTVLAGVVHITPDVTDSVLIS